MTSDYHDWITTPDASKIYGLPAELICQAIMRGQVRAKLIRNEPHIKRADVNALALLLKTEGDCHDCKN